MVVILQFGCAPSTQAPAIQQPESSQPKLEIGIDPATIVCTLDPTKFTYRIFDTVGDGKIHAIIAGDFNRNGILEWDDINAVIPLLCDPAKQDELGQPFCGTLFIPAGDWVSRINLDPDQSNLTDDQIIFDRPRKLTFKGCGVDVTKLTVRYSRADYCSSHKALGGGGLYIYEPLGDISVSDFTYSGLPGRTWGSKLDCDGDGVDDTGPRTSQTGIGIYATSGVDYKKNLHVENIKVTQVDYLGFIFTNWQNVTINNLVAQNYGATGFNISSIKDAVITNLTATGSQGTISEAGLNIESERDAQGLPQPQKLDNVIIDGYISRDNYRGLSVTALGGGGISNLTIRNIDIQDVGLRRPEWQAFIAMGIAFSDDGCKWDAQNQDGQHKGLLDDNCYITRVTIDGGMLRNIAGSAINTTKLSSTGSDRNYVFKGLTIEGAGRKLNNPDSQGVSLYGGTLKGSNSGFVFENSTLIGGDADGNGSPDLTQLLRIDSADYAVIRNNTFKGKTSNGPSTLLDLTNISNVSILGNVFSAEQAAGTAILLGNGALNNTIQDNLIRIPLTGTAIKDFTGSGSNQLIGNSIVVE